MCCTRFFVEVVPRGPLSNLGLASDWHGNKNVRNHVHGYYIPLSMTSSSSVLAALGSVSLSLPLSLVLFLYQRALIPLYGSVPTNRLLDRIVLATILVTSIQPFRISRSLKSLLGAVILLFAPNALYWVPVLTARSWKDPTWGPTLTHLLVLAPLVFVFVAPSIGFTFVSCLERAPTFETDAQLNRDPKLDLSFRLRTTCLLRDHAIS